MDYCGGAQNDSAELLWRGNLQKLECPVCYEIPEEEIFQCIEGHPVCKACHDNLLTCPQCRARFFEPKIRNRAFESMLDSLLLECQNKEHGCGVKLNRKDVKSHRESCDFRQSVKLCRKLGFNCDFEIHRHHVEAAIQHFKTEHQFFEARKGSAGSTKFCLTAFPFVATQLKPVLVRVEGNDKSPHAFMLLRKINGEDDSLTLTCVQLGNFAPGHTSQFVAKFCLRNGSGKNSDLRWMVAPFNFLNSDALLDRLPLRIPVALLRDHYMVRGGLVIDVEIVDTSKEVKVLTIQSQKW